MISVIIPTRIDRDMRCMGSLKMQIHENLEILIYPDWEEEGPAVLRNRGAGKAEGDELFFCDDDIELHPECLQEMYHHMQRYSAAFVYCDYMRGYPWCDTCRGMAFDYEELKQANYISTMSLVNKRVFEEVNGFDVSLKRFQDWDLWLRIGKKYPGVYIPKILFFANYDENSITTQNEFETERAMDIVRRKHGL